jgi:hypothetical protein
VAVEINVRDDATSADKRSRILFMCSNLTNRNVISSSHTGDDPYPKSLSRD